MYIFISMIIKSRRYGFDNAACVAGAMAREMGDLILLDSVLRDRSQVTRANAALPSPGVSCQVNVNRNLSFSGMRIGLPMDFWSSLDPAASLLRPHCLV